MAAGPSADVPGDFFAASASQDEREFWTEVDAARPGSKGRRHRASGRRGSAAAATTHAATSPTAPKTFGKRIAAAWAAESSARRALRGRPAGDQGGGSGRNRKVAAGIVGALALLAVGVAVTEAVRSDDPGSDQAAADPSSSGAGSDLASSEGSAGAGQVADDAIVESEIVDAPSTARTGSKARPKPAASTTTAPKAAEAPAASIPASGSSGGPSPSPATPAPATPVPSTVAPTPTTAPPTPTTAAPKPPAAPTIQTFTAKAASSAGGACPPLQWATTFTWATTNASSVGITGLLEQSLANLPGDGTRVVCRLLPTSPLGGWTLTAAGAGGSTTAKA